MELFPPFEPHASGMLAVGDGHDLYWEVSGNPDGPVAVFVHGGPGAGTAPTYRRFFDPRFWRIVLFDQRGSGRSRPNASVNANTQKNYEDLAKSTADEIERIERKLANEKFVANAPEEIIEGEKEKRQEAQDRRAKILEALERLKGAA